MSGYKFENSLADQSGFNLKRFLVTLAVLLLVSYGIFNARNLIIGPTIEIFSPTNDTETTENIAVIKGKAENIIFISLNEKPIFVSTDGLFEEKLLLVPGSNVIEIKAKDRFKKEARETIKIYYKQSSSTLEKLEQEHNSIGNVEDVNLI